MLGSCRKHSMGSLYLQSQAAGLIEKQLNGLLKELLFRLQNDKLTPLLVSLLPQVFINIIHALW